MHLIVIHKNEDYSANESPCLLRLAVSDKLIAGITFDRLSESCRFNGNDHTVITVPEQWREESSQHHPQISYYNENFPLLPGAVRKSKNDWLVISNGRFITSLNHQRLNRMLVNRPGLLHRWGFVRKGRKRQTGFDADLIAVNVDPALHSYRERLRITSLSSVAGFRRLYSDSLLPAPIPEDWPHHILVKLGVLDKILVDGALPLNFAEFVSRCASKSLNWRSFKIGGSVLDLETETGLLSFLTAELNSMRNPVSLFFCEKAASCHQLRYADGYSIGLRNRADGCTISADARLFSRVVLGNNVHIGDRVVIVGPTILGDNVKVASAAVIRHSVIGCGQSIPEGSVLQNCIIVGPESQRKLSCRYTDIGIRQINSPNLPFAETTGTGDNFRTWPRFSYARFGKRIADIIASLAVMILFGPLFPVIAVIIKLSSPGPVFFRHKRQGLHGKEFFCLKFKTMIVGADRIQEKLRFKNRVDGPQFKVQDDPRVTVVGRFLRDTFIDEIPQFINVLLGQMSVVGPRPSPRAENSSCPLWRDARLSVRPGITGLWQVYRTRQPGRDFQEWIYYDTQYIRNLSLRLDLLIFWKTAKKFLVNFIKQF